MCEKNLFAAGSICVSRVSLLLFLLLSTGWLPGEENAFSQEEKAPGKAPPASGIADVSSKECKIGGDEKKTYFLIGAEEGRKCPEKGYGLLVVMPGGDGGREFLPFVERIYKNALSPDYLVVQLVSVKWNDRQGTIWPTKKNPVNKMKFSTEDFVADTVRDVKKRYRIDAKRIFSLSWSSSGPAAYAAALQKKPVIAGSFIAMSVFKPGLLPSLKNGKKRPFYIYHSPEDEVCPYAAAEEAKKRLEKAGAKVVLSTYEGGHGWHGDVYGAIRKGIRWLEKNRKRR